MEERQEQKKKYVMEGPWWALFTMVLGFLFIKSIMGTGLGFGMFLFACGLIFVIIVQNGNQKKENEKGVSGKNAYIWSGFIILLALTFLYSDNDALKGMTLFLEMFLAPYAVFAAFGNRESSQIDGFMFLDGLKACFIIPFGNFSSLIKNLLFINKRGGKSFRYILLGLLLALIPTIMVMSLLWKDELFSNALKKITLSLNESLVENIVEFLFSIPVSMYLHGLLFGTANHSYSEVLTEAKKENISTEARCVPIMVTLSAMTPIMVIYLFYCILHLQYYIAAFCGKVPGDISTSEYARNGFFELCIVACINLFILLMGNVFTSRKEKHEKTTAWKVYATLLSILTIAISFSAIGKMLLYISIYGMTVKRLLTIWMIIFLGIIFIFIIILQWKKNFPIYKLSTVVGTIMLMMCVLIGPDGVAANYNIKAYQSGKLPELDIDAIADMSDQAVPYLKQIAWENTEYSEEIEQILREKESNDIWLYQNIQSLMAWRK